MKKEKILMQTFHKLAAHVLNDQDPRYTMTFQFDDSGYGTCFICKQYDSRLSEWDMWISLDMNDFYNEDIHMLIAAIGHELGHAHDWIHNRMKYRDGIVKSKRDREFYADKIGDKILHECGYYHYMIALLTTYEMTLSVQEDENHPSYTERIHNIALPIRERLCGFKNKKK